MTINFDANEFIWAEKYRPKKLDDVILPERIKEKFAEYIATKQIPHMLFSGSAGIGKTTVAKAICNEIDADMLYINASKENGIDTIRVKVTQFASTVSLEGNLKVILLDECLHEDENVRIGTVDDWKPVALKDLERDKFYPVVSLNTETGVLENDTGVVISDRNDEVFEVELEDGRTIRANSKHPFLVKTPEGKIVQKELMDLSENDEIISTT